VRAWYFERRLNQPLPDDIDAAVRELGFADRVDVVRALRREWLFSNKGGSIERG
jgi:Arc/MetJ-type ribon-helix-helix transcriptional regulator